jgi:hypothetical protein
MELTTSEKLFIFELLCRNSMTYASVVITDQEDLNERLKLKFKNAALADVVVPKTEEC